MEYHLEWRTSKVENYELSVSLHPAPDFAFMVEFDRFLDRYKRSGENRWGRVLLAQGKIVVSDVQPEFAHELRAFLDDAVREANRLAVDYRTYARQRRRKPKPPPPHSARLQRMRRRMPPPSGTRT